MQTLCWKNSDGLTKAVQQHLLKYHTNEYNEALKKQHLKQLLVTEVKPKIVELFTQAGFVTHLIQLISLDDQSINLVENLQFHKLMMYPHEDLLDSDIPHRQNIADEIYKHCEAEYAMMVDDMKKTLGCISTTSDVWSDTNLVAYIAVTAHYLKHNGK
ncbi:hypothetical protein FRB93_011540, partial [Tulasnella sp. JGI-2019a]